MWIELYWRTTDRCPVLKMGFKVSHLQDKSANRRFLTISQQVKPLFFLSPFYCPLIEGLPDSQKYGGKEENDC